MLLNAQIQLFNTLGDGKSVTYRTERMSTYEVLLFDYALPKGYTHKMYTISCSEFLPDVSESNNHPLFCVVVVPADIGIS
jgi:hypothetical protein